jgi:ABC-type polysaccharide/polyol phosphate transport system ATPase subunit
MMRIRFDNVSQHFRVIRERPDTLREAFTRIFKKSSFHDFQALKSVSFDISDGEVVGLVGRNGAGKSTILKIIAGVYHPTEGAVKVSGHVAGLIELGAGFHPDLTGRENIVINGLLLGLSRDKIRNREEEIVEFAELGEFIDSPIKQYSSGMVMRLAFSIATQVDPDILLIDEILAVGDAAFRVKCLARMDEFRKNKTIVYVSHADTFVRDMCTRAFLVHEGVLLADGPPDEVLAQYQELLQQHPVAAIP